jgi:hypothetical protein
MQMDRRPKFMSPGVTSNTVGDGGSSTDRLASPDNAERRDVGGEDGGGGFLLNTLSAAG